MCEGICVCVAIQNPSIIWSSVWELLTHFGYLKAGTTGKNTHFRHGFTVCKSVFCVNGYIKIACVTRVRLMTVSCVSPCLAHAYNCSPNLWLHGATRLTGLNMSHICFGMVNYMYTDSVEHLTIIQTHLTANPQIYSNLSIITNLHTSLYGQYVKKFTFSRHKFHFNKIYYNVLFSLRFSIHKKMQIYIHISINCNNKKKITNLLSLFNISYKNVEFNLHKYGMFMF